MRLTPEVDLTEHIAVDSYEVPPRLARQIDQRVRERVLPPPVVCREALAQADLWPALYQPLIALN